jgi:hypothetical protein
MADEIVDADFALAAIRLAITRRHRLAFSYQDLPRVVNPLRLGLTPHGGWQMRALQVGGDSASGTYGRTPKLFAVAEMSDVTILTAHFRVPRQYEPGDEAFAEIVAEL